MTIFAASTSWAGPCGDEKGARLPESQGGGWVSTRAYVGKTVWVGRDAVVCGNAKLEGNVKVVGKARLESQDASVLSVKAPRGQIVVSGTLKASRDGFIYVRSGLTAVDEGAEAEKTESDGDLEISGTLEAKGGAIGITTSTKGAKIKGTVIAKDRSSINFHDIENSVFSGPIVVEGMGQAEFGGKNIVHGAIAVQGGSLSLFQTTLWDQGLIIAPRRRCSIHSRESKIAGTVICTEEELDLRHANIEEGSILVDTPRKSESDPTERALQKGAWNLTEDLLRQRQLAEIERHLMEGDPKKALSHQVQMIRHLTEAKRISTRLREIEDQLTHRWLAQNHPATVLDGMGSSKTCPVLIPSKVDTRSDTQKLKQVVARYSLDKPYLQDCINDRGKPNTQSTTAVDRRVFAKCEKQSAGSVRPRYTIKWDSVAHEGREIFFPHIQLKINILARVKSEDRVFTRLQETKSCVQSFFATQGILLDLTYQRFQDLEPATTVELHEKVKRSNSKNWGLYHDIGGPRTPATACQMIRHEVSHLLGALDRYKDKEKCPEQELSGERDDEMGDGEYSFSSTYHPDDYRLIVGPLCGDPVEDVVIRPDGLHFIGKDASRERVIQELEKPLKP